MERTMTLWRTERGSAPLFTPNAPTRYLDLAGLVVIVAAPGLLLLWLVPLPLVLPVLSIMSFAIAGVAALVAHYSGNRSPRARRISLGYRCHIHVDLDRRRDDRWRQASHRTVRSSCDDPIERRGPLNPALQSGRWTANGHR